LIFGQNLDFRLKFIFSAQIRLSTKIYIFGPNFYLWPYFLFTFFREVFLLFLSHYISINYGPQFVGTFPRHLLYGVAFGGLKRYEARRIEMSNFAQKFWDRTTDSHKNGANKSSDLLKCFCNFNSLNRNMRVKLKISDNLNYFLKKSFSVHIIFLLNIFLKNMDWPRPVN